MTFNSCFRSTLPKQGSKESSLCLSVQTFVSKYFHMNCYVNCKVQRDFVLKSTQVSGIVMCSMRSAALAWRTQSQNRPRLQIHDCKHLCDQDQDTVGMGAQFAGRGRAGVLGSRPMHVTGNHSYTHGVMELDQHAEERHALTYHASQAMPRCGVLGRRRTGGFKTVQGLACSFKVRCVLGWGIVNLVMLTVLSKCPMRVVITHSLSVSSQVHFL